MTPGCRFGGFSHTLPGQQGSRCNSARVAAVAGGEESLR